MKCLISIHHFIAALQGIEDCGKQLSIVDEGLLAFDRADLNNSPVPSSCLHKGFMSTISYHSGESEGRTKIPDPPIHFSGPTNFFGPKIDFTNHQFETSVLLGDFL